MTVTVEGQEEVLTERLLTHLAEFSDRTSEQMEAEMAGMPMPTDAEGLTSADEFYE